VNYLSRAVFFSGLLLSGGAWSGQDSEQPQTPTAMQPVRFGEWESTLRQHLGHITVVDLWASWCAPCLERFPHMVDLYHKYSGRNVNFISLNFDQQGDEESLQWANQFLRRVGAIFPNYHMDENMSQAFERLNLLGLPVVLVYDADGTEAYRLTGDDPDSQFNDKDVESAVLSLLGRQTGQGAGALRK
jgi:thiol-disulfide isomerase/thioredoxin